MSTSPRRFRLLMLTFGALAGCWMTSAVCFPSSGMSANEIRHSFDQNRTTIPSLVLWAAGESRYEAVAATEAVADFPAADVLPMLSLVRRLPLRPRHRENLEVILGQLDDPRVWAWLESDVQSDGVGLSTLLTFVESPMPVERKLQVLLTLIRENRDRGLAISLLGELRHPVATQLLLDEWRSQLDSGGPDLRLLWDTLPALADTGRQDICQLIDEAAEIERQLAQSRRSWSSRGSAVQSRRCWLRAELRSAGRIDPRELALRLAAYHQDWKWASELAKLAEESAYAHHRAEIMEALWLLPGRYGSALAERPASLLLLANEGDEDARRLLLTDCEEPSRQSCWPEALEAMGSWREPEVCRVLVETAKATEVGLRKSAWAGLSLWWPLTTKPDPYAPPHQRAPFVDAWERACHAYQSSSM